MNKKLKIEKLKSEPRYSFNFRYREDVKKAIEKIQRDRGIKFRNDAVILAIKIVADNNFKQ